MGWTVKNICLALLLTLFFISIEANSKVTFVPSHYNISIVTQKEHFENDDPTGLKYGGTVNVLFKMNSPKNFKEVFSIILNTNKKTKVENLELKAKKNENFEKIDCPYEVNDGKLTLKCNETYAAYTEFDLTVAYKNPFGDDMTGFYRSSYVDSQKQKRWLLTTHFEPIFARDAFPCFDEPHLKSTFKVTLKVPQSITSVLSNTQVESNEKDGEFQVYKFKKTDIPMSTYLVAFTASNLKSTGAIKFKSKYEGQTTEEKDLCTYGRKEIIDNKEGELAQNVGKATIELTTDYLKMGYPLQKVDQVGIPDFSAGAMENFGHISFREKSLFYNKTTSSTMTKQSNLLTVVHELIHQWFGNLVTLESWDYIWLNEAFATYLEYVIASKINITDINSVDWELMKQMVVNEIHLRAFETDGLHTSKPLNNKITNETDIFASFNDIPYSKGAAVLRMWDLSHETGKFQESLQAYMKNRKEKSANSSQLFEAFREKAKMNEKTFTSWTDKPGYPVVKVVKCTDTYSISQSRFLWGKEQKQSNYRIPITYTTSDQKNFSTVATTWLEEGKVTVKASSKSKWIIVNNQQAGYYRVNYGVENWQALAKELKEGNYTAIPDLNRAQLIDDVFSLARSLQENYVNYSVAFDLVDYLKKENSFIPLKTALNSFEFLRTKLYNETVFRKFQERVLKLLRPHFKSLKSVEESHIAKLKKVEIARWACSLDEETCLKEAKEIYSTNNYTKYADIQEIVLCTVVRTNKTAWQEIFNKYKNEQDSPLRVMYLTALGCTNDQKTAEEFLNSTLTANSGIRKQDLMFILTAVYNGNLKNLDVAFTFVEKYFNEIANTYGGINPLGRAIVGIARKINNDKQCERLKKLVTAVKNNPAIQGTEESLENALQIAKSNCEWNSVKMDGLKEYLNSAHSLASYSFSLLLLCLLFVFQF